MNVSLSKSQKGLRELSIGMFLKDPLKRTKMITKDDHHRLRLREEVETLQHLTDISRGRCHPNILVFIDAWEEDEQLFIWTELCEGGNFAHFLWEYGRVFPRLDQARVWKIIVELSNVSLHRFEIGRFITSYHRD